MSLENEIIALRESITILTELLKETNSFSQNYIVATVTEEKEKLIQDTTENNITEEKPEKLEYEIIYEPEIPVEAPIINYGEIRMRAGRDILAFARKDYDGAKKILQDYNAKSIKTIPDELLVEFSQELAKRINAG